MGVALSFGTPAREGQLPSDRDSGQALRLLEMSAYTNTKMGAEAERAAETLDQISGHGFQATAKKLGDKFYIVVHARGDELGRAYPFPGIDLVAARADFVAWHTSAKPEECVEVAVSYFMPPHDRQLARQDGTAILSKSERDVLELRCAGKPCGDGLSPQQIKILKIATALGWPGPE